MSEQARKTIIAGNWKMHKTRHKARELAEQIVAAFKHDHKNLPEIVLCPPFTSLHDVVQACHNSPVSVGAQTMEYRTSGAFTGEISPTMLTDVGATWVIIGHSERRQYYNETDKTVNLKLKAALEHRLLPIVCVGELLEEREKNETDAVIRRQVEAALVDVSESHLKPLVIAYEPVWAIGTGKTCESVEANRVAKFIREVISEIFSKGKGSADSKQLGNLVPILYGGSVKPSTVDELMAQSDVDGALVGGAALASEDFIPLIQSAHKRIKQQLSRV